MKQSTNHRPLLEENDGDILTDNPGDYGLPGDEWYPNQKGMVRRALTLDKNKFLFLEAPTGCHAPGQGILMYDGSVKKVEDVAVGDQLMGPDSLPRNVLSLARGHDDMVRIVPVKGTSFIVNMDHILTLQRTGTKYRAWEMVDVSVREWLEWSNWRKHIHKLVRTGVKFNRQDDVYNSDFYLDPYFLGLLIGDGGYTNSPNITSADKEIVEEIYKQAEVFGLKVREDKKPNNKAVSYYMTGDGVSNYLSNRLRQIGLYGRTSGEKFIPPMYKTSSRDARLDLIAGILDADGSLSSNGYDFISKSKQLAEDVAYVARSLGMAAYISEAKKSDQNGTLGVYHRVFISGETSQIPCRIDRKKAKERKQVKSVLRTGFSIESVGMGEYFGFSLDGDGRYLMDDFTITHNTGKSFSPALVSRFRPVTVMVATRDLQRQYEDSFDWFSIVWGQAHYPCILPSKMETYEKAYGEIPTRGDCTIDTQRETCPVISDCPYEIAKREAKTSGAMMLNYAYAYYTNWWRRADVGDIFCDEAHRLPDVLADLISIEISEKQRREYSLPPFPLASGGSGRAIDIIRSYLDKALRALEDWKDLAKSIGGDEKQMLRCERFRKKIEGLKDALSIAEPDTWYIASGESLGRLIARPIFPKQYASRILDHNARAVTMMSATIGNAEVLASRLGIPTNRIEFISVPHGFPKKNRPVLLFSNAPKMSSKSTERDYEYQADLISGILAGSPEHKGIIHTTSWKHTNLLCKLLTKRGHGDRVFSTKGPRVQTVKRFRNSKQGTVAISPSWSEGLDFPDDDARFAIIAKIPWRSLADPVTRLRLGSEGGREWYDWTACLGVVQRAGRVVRHIDDWGITYIVDGNWSRVERLAPEWFEVTRI